MRDWLNACWPETRAPGWVTAGLLLIAFGTSCGNREALGMSVLSVVSPGVINDPSNKSLRFDLLKFGLDRFCVEMLRRGAPLKLSDTEPVLGRFFADSCQARVLDEPQRQSVLVNYSGQGYGWTNLTGRLGFSSAGWVEYAADFQLQADALYIYFRPRNVGGASFHTLLVESALAQIGLGVSGVDPDAIGQDIVRRQLARGFTVIRHSNEGEVEFSLGVVPAGQRPFRPYQVVSSDKITLDDDRTELHGGQQDFIGGLSVPDGGSRISLSLGLDGTPALDVFVVSAADAHWMTQAYVHQAGGARLPRAPLVDAELHAGTPLRVDVNLAGGNYYLVLDHSSVLGRSNPPPGDQAAKVDYLVQLGER